MDQQIAIAVGIALIVLCSAGLVLLLPTLAIASVRGNVRGAGRIVALLVALAAVALVVSAAIGAMPSAYLVLF